MLGSPEALPTRKPFWRAYSAQNQWKATRTLGSRLDCEQPCLHPEESKLEKQRMRGGGAGRDEGVAQRLNPYLYTPSPQIKRGERGRKERHARKEGERESE